MELDDRPKSQTEADAVDVNRILAPADDDLPFPFEGIVKPGIEMLNLSLHDLIVEVVYSRDLEDGVIAQEDVGQLSLR